MLFRSNNILTRGGVKRKLALYFTDMALFNTTGDNASIDSPRRDLDRELITREQKAELWSMARNLTNAKDKALLSEFIRATRSLATLKPQIESKYLEYLHTSNHLARELELNLKEVVASYLIPKTMESLYNKLGEEEKKKALKELDVFPFALNSERDKKTIKALVNLTNENKRDLRYFINVSEAFCKEYLDLKPYYDYFRDLEELVEASELKILGKLEKRKEILKNFSVDDKGKELSIEILKIKEIGYKATPEDIEAVKSLAQ